MLLVIYILWIEIDVNREISFVLYDFTLCIMFKERYYRIL